MRPGISVVIPAFNEAGHIASTVAAALRIPGVSEVVVVDDGSVDDTAALAAAAGATVVRLERNLGKGGALARGVEAASGEILLLLDADLGETAAEGRRLLKPVLDGDADMTTALLPRGNVRAGVGLVVRTARWGVWLLGGRALAEPLSGQRAVRREVLDAIGPLAPGFGVEVGLTIDALRRGFRVLEVPTAIRHNVTGRSVRAFLHRGRQFVHVCRALWQRARRKTVGG